ncbi:MAG TPA: tetratricopeptide repeat protein [Phenylobacterium sp.]|jgi:tetratricopeptide (TPR) repeat protein|uniref:tetratricopeptide repeat protein n=1 Tax=Phenylobacterium sp. TaxID=1871053 RepID=UPI002D72756C|nr:tetratricopeptide repeat protein [Phenylobacterium sp.]HZZ69208.1 tetratricopeptide repeat protein [Phenylobacterium sp.]
MRLHLLLAAAAPLILLAACAEPGTSAPPASGELAANASPYGMFLAGESALNNGKSRDAARFFDQARVETGDAMIGERAFTAALLAGEIQKASTLAPTGDDASEAGKRLGKLVVAVEDLADGKGKEAKALLTDQNIAFPHKPAGALLAPWAAAEAGDVEGSLVRPEVRGDRMVDYFGQLGQAALFERAKRYDEAETDFKAVAGTNNPTEMAVLGYGAFLERRGRRVDALALYAEELARDPDSIAVKAAQARASTGKAPPPMPTIREGAAAALLAPAATMISAKQTQLALAYLRLVLRLDPQLDDAWVMVGDLMDGSGDVEAARAAYSHPKPGSPEYSAAQAKLAWTYQSADDKETALKLARAAATTGDVDARITLADLLRSDEQYPEAIKVLDGVIAEQKAPDWRLLYSRGVAEERLDHWTQAQADLQAALKAHPDEPELLNYLGYSWIDRGEHLKEAMAMVEKAVAADPRSGAMVDSLGWAYYRMGDYKKAVEKLEEAVELEAGDPEINNHLGDAYWRVGRRDEAQFQWRRVLTLKPDDKIKANAEAKLASGLGPDGPTPKLAKEP